MRSILVAAAVAGLVGCGGNPEPATPAAPPPAAPRADEPRADAPPALKGPCPDMQACYDAGRVAHDARDKAKAAVLYAAGCEMGSGQACVALAMDASERDVEIDLHLRGCKLGNKYGCLNAAEMLSKGARRREGLDLFLKTCKSDGDADVKKTACARGAIVAREAKDYGRAVELAREVCNDQEDGGCNLLGVLYANGEGVPRDLARAAALFDRGCKAGDEAGCDNHENERRLTEASSRGALEVEGANLRMGSLSADGFTMRDIACRVDGGGFAMLMVGPVIAGGMAKRKAALDACAPKGAEVRVRWTMAGRRVTKVEARAGDKKIEACVANAVKSSVAVVNATCAAGFKIGRGR
jgi:hypothetical protein